ncbi:MAG: hypothetical protein INH41_27720, partial [Myxococcaceae bacterium]|nr:hypothetical protein [Myxococcaceae bacterium]
NDCDGRADEDFNLMSDAANCGMCNRACIPPPFVATTACGGGQCGLTACVPGRGDCNSSYVDGCEVDTSSTVAHCGQCGRACSAPSVATYRCTSGACGINACAAGRGDCNGGFLDGCEVDTTTSVTHCGACGATCAIANGTPRCVSGTCQVNTCTGTFRDCNGSAADGCETNVATSTSNCGACGQVCSRPFSSASCVSSTCQYACLPGRVDADGDPSNGCELGCTVTGVDVPDLAFEDANCDALDGQVTAAIFVAKTGSDANPGTRAAPKLTIGGGINAALAAGRTQVLVSEGQYDERVTLSSGIGVYGGYSAANGWARAATYVTTINSPAAEGVVAQNLAAATELQLVTVRAANAVGQEANGDGRSSVAVLALDSTGALTVRGCTLRPGAGSAGSAGAPGTVGATGGPGAPGAAGAAGAPGASPCGASGGAGGPSVSGEANGSQGFGGVTAPSGATGGNPGSGGTRGDCSTFAASNGGDAPPVTANGGAGLPGAHGFPGATLGTLLSGAYRPPTGTAGATGQAGGGGGGGGSGGGTQRGSGILCTGCSSLTSGGGGGGGGGGCGGTGGAGGRGGGGSFGVLAANAPVTVTASTIVTAGGGAGGAGGAGGQGGPGGTGGSGGAGQTYSGSCSSKRAGNGAQGASGGPGGWGGGGSGGTGGPSVCVAYRGPVATLTGGACSNAPPATGGPGGSNGASSAPPGTAGASTNLSVLP